MDIAIDVNVYSYTYTHIYNTIFLKYIYIIDYTVISIKSNHFRFSSLLIKRLIKPSLNSGVKKKFHFL